MTIATTNRVTLEEYFVYSSGTGDHYELVDGEMSNCLKPHTFDFRLLPSKPSLFRGLKYCSSLNHFRIPR
jgi:hypothetical protein